MEPERTCEWYTTEGEVGDYYHDESVDDGFCLLLDLFTRCSGKCEAYRKAKCKNDKESV